MGVVHSYEVTFYSKITFDSSALYLTRAFSRRARDCWRTRFDVRLGRTDTVRLVSNAPPPRIAALGSSPKWQRWCRRMARGGQSRFDIPSEKTVRQVLKSTFNMLKPSILKDHTVYFKHPSAYYFVKWDTESWSASRTNEPATLPEFQALPLNERIRTFFLFGQSVCLFAGGTGNRKLWE